MVTVMERKNPLLSAIKAAGYKSISEFSKECGVSSKALGDLARGKIGPKRRKSTKFNLTTEAVFDVLGLAPEEIWDESQLKDYTPYKVNWGDEILSKQDAEDIQNYQITDDPEETLSLKEIDNEISKFLNTITPREAYVVREHILGDKTLDDIAFDLDVTRERVRQIECKALRKLRHPSRFVSFRISTGHTTLAELAGADKRIVEFNIRHAEDIAAYNLRKRMEKDEDARKQSDAKVIKERSDRLAREHKEYLVGVAASLDSSGARKANKVSNNSDKGLYPNNTGLSAISDDQKRQVEFKRRLASIKAMEAKQAAYDMVLKLVEKEEERKRIAALSINPPKQLRLDIEPTGETLVQYTGSIYSAKATMRFAQPYRIIEPKTTQLTREEKEKYSKTIRINRIPG